MIDEIIFRKAVKGDGDSFYKLIEPIKDNLYKMAFSYVGNEQDALDCVHESIVKAIRSLPLLKEPQHFNTWINRIVINSCKDYIRKNNKVTLVDIQDYESIALTEDDKFIEAEELYLALNQLKKEEKDLIVMRYINDLSLKTLAEKFNLPLGTIKSRVNRTLIKLRVYMEESKR